MEVAGVVLGAVALVGPVYDLYHNCVSLLTGIRDCSRDLKKCGETISIQQRIFLQQFQLILRALVEDDLAAAMLEDKNHSNWSNVDFQGEWEKTMGDCFDTPLRITRETLGEIESKLSKLQAKIGTNQSSTSAPPSSNLTKTERFKAVGWRIDWCQSGKKELQKLIDTLKAQNQDLRTLREQRNSLQKPGPRFRELHSKPPDSKIILEQLLAIREVAKRVYDGLAVTARCSCHRVNLQLRGQLDDLNSKQGVSSPGNSQKPTQRSVSAISFRLILTKDTGGQNPSLDSSGHCECTCITISSELQPEDLRKRSATTDSEPGKKRVRFSEQHVETSSARAIITVPDDKQPTRKRVMSIDLGSGNKRVKFEFPNDDKSSSTRVCVTIDTDSKSTTLDSNTSSSMTTLNVTEIDNLCLHLAKLQSGTQKKELLGRIPNKGCSPTYRHLMYRDPSTSGLTSRTSLETILERADKQCLLPRLERLKVALILSLSLLHFGTNSKSWFQERWRSRDIFFFLKIQQQIPESGYTLDPYVVPFFSAPGKSVGEIPMIPPKGIARNEQLFSLALVLIEIAFGNTLFKIYEPSKIPEKSGDDINEYMKAKSILESGMLAREMGSVYSEVAKRCLYCEFGILEHDLSKEELQKIFYEKVVCELERCLKKFQEM